MSHWKSITQDVKASSLNSSPPNYYLHAYAESGYADTYIGLSESTLGVAGIQVSLKSDRNCLISVDQSPDGINWDITDEMNYYASRGGDGWTFQAINSYFRVRCQNLDDDQTTYFRLQTALCPIVEAMPRALSAEGNMKVGVYEIEDDDGHKVDVTPMYELRTSEHVRLVGTAFSGTTFDTNFWAKTQVGAGDATLGNATLTLNTGTIANGSILVSSVRKGRYVGGTPNYYRAVVRCPATTSTNVKAWGAYNATDGAFFRMNGTTFSVVVRKNSSDTNIVNTGSFNGVKGGNYTLDTKPHTFEIHWTNSSVWFYIDGELLHKFSSGNTSLMDTLTLTVAMECTNINGNTSANTLEVRTATINRIGKETTSPIWKHLTAATGLVLKYGAGRLHKVVFNTFGNGAIVNLYDALTATNMIAGLNPPNGIFPGTVPYDLDFYDGLTITITGTVDLTIVYE